MQFRVKSEIVRINFATPHALYGAVVNRFKSGQGFALATLNLDHLVKLSASKSFRDAYAKQDLVVADGNPIVWLSHLAGKPVSLMPGSELILPLAKLAAKEKIKVALVGSTGATLKKASVVLKKQIPDLEITISIAPSFGFDPKGLEADAILAKLKIFDTGLCFLALGAPKQEVFAAHGRTIAPHICFASIGAGLDFIAGHQTRAPKWVRKFAMEWLWRMLFSPLRLGPRYLRCILILPKLMADALRLRMTKARQ